MNKRDAADSEPMLPKILRKSRKSRNPKNVFDWFDSPEKIQGQKFLGLCFISALKK